VGFVAAGEGTSLGQCRAEQHTTSTAAARLANTIAASVGASSRRWVAVLACCWSFCLRLPIRAALSHCCRTLDTLPPSCRPRNSGSSSSSGLVLELGVPDASFAAALLRAVSGPGLASVSIAVREAADPASVAALAAAPGAAQQLAGLDVEFRAAPTADDVLALAGCSGLRRLHVSCKCPRAPAGMYGQRVRGTQGGGVDQLAGLQSHVGRAQSS
jgi:hypothetical protein